MTIQFHPDAELEFRKAIEYYELQERGLGFRFSSEVKRALERIRINPTAWTSISKNIRRTLTYRFPYGILYHYDEADRVILAYNPIVSSSRAQAASRTRGVGHMLLDFVHFASLHFLRSK